MAYKKSKRGFYWCTLKDVHEVKVHVRLFRDKTTSEAAETRIKRLVELRQGNMPFPRDLTSFISGAPNHIRQKLVEMGVLDPEQEAASADIHDIVDEWITSILARGRTQEHVDRQKARILRVIEEISVKRVNDLTAERVNSFLLTSKEKDTGGRRTNPGGMGATTRNHYRATCRAFGNWLVETERLSKCSLQKLKLENVRKDKRCKRRALSLDEQCRLIEAALRGKDWQHVPGLDRAGAYALALKVGLRRGEVESLKVADVDFGRRLLHLRAEITKNGKDEYKPLPDDVLKLLSMVAAGKEAGDKLLHTARQRVWARMLRHDLKEAGVPYATEQGNADFHSLRHTFSTMVVRSGVSPKVAQSLMRHSNTGLTLEVYTHLGDEEERHAIDALPSLFEVGSVVPHDADSTKVQTGHMGDTLDRTHR